MSRYPALPLSKLPTDVQPWAQELHHFVEELALTKEGPVFQYAQDDGALIGPYPIVIASKEIGKVLKDMQDALRRRPEPSAEVRVVAILAVVSKFQAKFAKYSFTATGKNVAGMSAEQLAALRNGTKPAGLSEAASVTWDVVDYLVNEKGPLPDPLYHKAVEVLGKEGVLVAVHYAGFYSHICMLENFADAPYPDGVDGL